MLGNVQIAGARQLGALLVALSVSGAPGALARLAPPARHVCSCRSMAGEPHRCSCELCRRAALAAQADDPTLPPCHRAAAREALDGERRGAQRGAPCVEGTCGTPGKRAPGVASTDTYFPPVLAALAVLLREQPTRCHLAALVGRSPEPERPRPRRFS